MRARVMLLVAMAFFSACATPPAPTSAEYRTVADIRYRNLFAEHLGVGEAEIDAKLGHYWSSLFEGDGESRVYFPGDPNASGATGYILDVGNDDVRSEGMSYGMMIAVQTDRRDVFDALWNWAYSHMRYASGPRQGYFRWQCTRSGCPRDAVPASDGEEYFATALFFAAHRWGSRAGLYDYEAQANAILDTMLHKEEMNGGVVDGVTNMFDRETHQVVFVPNGRFARFTDPSYHLPAFYELWARWAAGWQGRRDEDRAFWHEAARRSRLLLERAAHPETGLTPDYSEFDGRPHVRDGHEDFRFDAFRSAMNWSVDHAWWGLDPAAIERTDRLQAFFEAQGMDRYANQFRIDGTPLSAERSSALIAANGAASLAASHSRARRFVEAQWALEPPRGRWRYYNGMIEFIALLHASGRFRAW
jgi:oligosaccharide reducing-end xylanase